MSTAPTREVARRLFAREFNDITTVFTEEEGDMAPNYALLPTGAKANRVLVVGTLTETEDIGEDAEYWRGHVVDPSGEKFFTYAGQYQPEAAATLRELETPAYVAIVGKPRTFTDDDGDTYASIRPESITVVSEEIRDRWVVETANQTLNRIERFQEATQADDEDETVIQDTYIEMASEEYGFNVEPYRQAAVEALEAIEDAEVVEDGGEVAAAQ
jgi:RPA family protein